MRVLHKLVNGLANRLPLGRQAERDLMETVLRQLPQATYWRLRERGFAPGSIVDVGAHEGHWTRLIRSIFATAPIVMIEARQEQEPTLRQVCVELPGIEYVIALLGREPHAAALFQVGGTGSSIFPEHSDVPMVARTIPMRTLDDVLAEKEQLIPPLFLKLDVQGGELECLCGAKAALAETEVVQLEVALLNYNEGAPDAVEIISFMDANDFAMFDIASFVRPNGRDLAQIDVIFVKKNSKLRPDFFRFSSD